MKITGITNLPDEKTLLVHYTLAQSGTWVYSICHCGYRNACDDEWTIMIPNHQHPRHTDARPDQPLVIDKKAVAGTFAWNYGGIPGIKAEDFDANHSFLVQLTLQTYKGEPPGGGNKIAPTGSVGVPSGEGPGKKKPGWTITPTPPKGPRLNNPGFPGTPTPPRPPIFPGPGKGFKPGVPLPPIGGGTTRRKGITFVGTEGAPIDPDVYYRNFDASPPGPPDLDISFKNTSIMSPADDPFFSKGGDPDKWLKNRSTRGVDKSFKFGNQGKEGPEKRAGFPIDFFNDIGELYERWRSIASGEVDNEIVNRVPGAGEQYDVPGELPDTIDPMAGAFIKGAGNNLYAGPSLESEPPAYYIAGSEVGDSHLIISEEVVEQGSNVVVAAAFVPHTEAAVNGRLWITDPKGFSYTVIELKENKSYTKDDPASMEAMLRTDNLIPGKIKVSAVWYDMSNNVAGSSVGEFNLIQPTPDDENIKAEPNKFLGINDISQALKARLDLSDNPVSETINNVHYFIASGTSASIAVNIEELRKSTLDYSMHLVGYDLGTVESGYFMEGGYINPTGGHNLPTVVVDTFSTIDDGAFELEHIVSHDVISMPPSGILYELSMVGKDVKDRDVPCNIYLNKNGGYRVVSIKSATSSSNGYNIDFYTPYPNKEVKLYIRGYDKYVIPDNPTIYSATTDYLGVASFSDIPVDDEQYFTLMSYPYIPGQSDIGTFSISLGLVDLGN